MFNFLKNRKTGTPKGEEGGRKVFIACFPKSASTFLARTIQSITHFEFVIYTYGKGRNEQELYKPLLEQKRDIDTVTHQHLRATEPNIKLLQDFGIRPIVLVRNIFDSLVSLRDHLVFENEKWPMAYVTEDFKTLSSNEQMQFILQFIAPWYFNFYVSWYTVKESNLIQTKWISYETFNENNEIIISDILDFYNLSQGVNISTHAKENRNSENRFNIGEVGRGKEIFTHKQIEIVKNMAGFYPKVDFSSIGI